MAAELGLLSLTQLQELAQQHQPPPPPPISYASAASWMWNPNQLPQEDDDSWEIRAFEQDTGNINGTTWPPRSYTCTFCRREFRSAQALGGHMNVHRRDRARLHHQAHPGITNSPANFPSSTLLIPAPEFVSTNGGLCLIYSLANPNNGVVSPAAMNSCMDSPNSYNPLSISSTSPNTNLISSTCYPPSHPPSLNSSISHSANTELSASNTSNNDMCENKKDSAIEELDLELRLGRR